MHHFYSFVNSHLNSLNIINFSDLRIHPNLKQLLLIWFKSSSDNLDLYCYTYRLKALSDSYFYCEPDTRWDSKPDQRELKLIFFISLELQYKTNMTVDWKFCCFYMWCVSRMLLALNYLNHHNSRNIYEYISSSKWSDTGQVGFNLR